MTKPRTRTTKPKDPERPQNPLTEAVLLLGWWSSRNKEWSVLVTGLLAAVGGYMTDNEPQFGPAKFTFHAPWWGLGLLAMAAFMAFSRVYWERKDDSAEVRAEVRDRFFEEDLAPLLSTAATIASIPRRVERISEAKRAADRTVLILRNAFIDVADVRVVVFRVSDDGQRMTPDHMAGRPQRPGDFVRGTARGDKAFEVLEKHSKRTLVVPDLDKEDVDTWEGTGDGYKTFITAPIRSDTEGYGLLTVDAPEPESLDRAHATSLAMFAAALAVVLAEAARGGQTPRNGTTTEEE